jgi:hypothetical protein
MSIRLIIVQSNVLSFLSRWFVSVFVVVEDGAMMLLKLKKYCNVWLAFFHTQQCCASFQEPYNVAGHGAIVSPYVLCIPFYTHVMYWTTIEVCSTRYTKVRNCFNPSVIVNSCVIMTTSLRTFSIISSHQPTARTK